MPRHMLRPPALMASAVVLAGCFTSTADFQRDAEQFIVENEELATAVETTFASADCEEPINQEPGTVFACTAIDDDGREWEFQVSILDSDEYEVNILRFPSEPG